MSTRYGEPFNPVAIVVALSPANGPYLRVHSHSAAIHPNRDGLSKIGCLHAANTFKLPLAKTSCVAAVNAKWLLDVSGANGGLILQVD